MNLALNYISTYKARDIFIQKDIYLTNLDNTKLDYNSDLEKVLEINYSNISNIENNILEESIDKLVNPNSRVTNRTKKTNII